MKACVSRSVVSDPLRPHGLSPAKLLCPWNSPGKNTGVGSLSLLQGIFSTQRSNPGLPHCRRIFFRLSLPGSPSSPKSNMTRGPCRKRCQPVSALSRTTPVRPPSWTSKEAVLVTTSGQGLETRVVSSRAGRRLHCV